MEELFELLREAAKQAQCDELSYQGLHCVRERFHERMHTDGRGHSWMLDLDHPLTVELEFERIKKMYEKDV